MDRYGGDDFKREKNYSIIIKMKTMKSIEERFVKKVLLSIAIVLLNMLSFGATYYIAPSGNDNNTGAISSPWATLNKAWTVIKAGDTVYLRGGTYAFNAQQRLTGKNGASGTPINVWAYPNETPILSKSGSYPATFGIFFTGNYFHWKGIEIAGYTQPSGSVLSYAIRVENSSYNTFEKLKVHGNGCGMTIVNNGYTLHSTGNLVLNCDFYENQDPLTTGDPYGNSDGLSIAWITHPEDINTVKGCRFWWNSDDGIDMFSNDGQVVIENCQSFYNGYIPKTFTAAGDGIGYKFGNNLTDLRNNVKRVAKNCISVKNRSKGYSTNGIYGKIEISNSTAYQNGSIGIHLADFNLGHSAKNCLSYSNATNIGLSTTGTYLTNSWQNNLVVSNADFKSLDPSLLLTARQSDGSLAVTDFMQLASTSKLINAGTNVGTPYSGTAPDLGSYEFNGAIATATAVATTIQRDEYISICNGMSYNTWTITGKYSRTLIAKSGADSIVNTYLTVNPTYSIIQNITIKEGQDYKGWTKSGQYIQNLKTKLGCDSIITINLKVASKFGRLRVFVAEAQKPQLAPDFQKLYFTGT